jgi:hypothetical protein
MLRIGAHSPHRSQHTPTGDSGSRKGFDPGTTLGQRQWTNRDGWEPAKSLVASGNTSHAQIAGNESSSYVRGELNALEFLTGTGFTEDGTGAGFEASLAELQGDAKFRFSPNGLTLGAGGEMNLASLRADAGFGHDLGNIVDGKLYAGAHGEMLVGANADANLSLNLNPLNRPAGAARGPQDAASRDRASRLRCEEPPARTRERLSRRTGAGPEPPAQPLGL